MQIQAEVLDQIARRIFEAAGPAPDEAAEVARRLIEANLCGHDSHGVIRVHQYVTFVRDGCLVPGRHAEMVRDVGAVAVAGLAPTAARS